MHPMFGVPQMYHDQLNIVARHLHDIKVDTQLQQQTKGHKNVLPTVAKLTQRTLKQKDNWAKWQNAEFQQLDMYKQQDTF